MAEQTRIEWTDCTWNPWEGCTKVSPGCTHCYAETRNHRFGNDNWGKGKPRRRTVDWKKPVRWNEQPWICDECGMAHALPGQICMTPNCVCETKHRARVFASLQDWLDDEVPIEWLADFLKLIHDTPNLDWLPLTKRPENFGKQFDTLRRLTWVKEREWIDRWFNGTAPQNIWLGTSVENQEYADRRIPELLKIPAAVRFLSVEPMLGPVDLKVKGDVSKQKYPDDFARWSDKRKEEWFQGTARATYIARTTNVDWVIFGGESGPGARPCNVEWIRDGVRQCRAAGVPAFVKQLGAVPTINDASKLPGMAAGFPEGTYFTGLRALLKDKKGGDMSEWPEDLRVREFPTTERNHENRKLD